VYEGGREKGKEGGVRKRRERQRLTNGEEEEQERKGKSCSSSSSSSSSRRERKDTRRHRGRKRRAKSAEGRGRESPHVTKHYKQDEKASKHARKKNFFQESRQQHDEGGIEGGKEEVCFWCLFS